LGLDQGPQAPKQGRNGVRPLFAAKEAQSGFDIRHGPPMGLMQRRRLAPQLSQRRNNASVVTANNGLTPAGVASGRLTHPSRKQPERPENQGQHAPKDR
jgi:hypothetical protein